MSPVRCSPLEGEVVVLQQEGAGATTAMDVDAKEPVFAGHYPGFPIFPGVCLIEFAHQSALKAPPEGDARLTLMAIDRARFLSPVYPGDRVQAELDWTVLADESRCVAVLSTERGVAAHVRLRYEGAGR